MSHGWKQALAAVVTMVWLLLALVAASPAAAAHGLSMAFSVAPSVAGPGANATWTIVLTPSGTAYTNLGVAWSPGRKEALTFDSCTPVCIVSPTTGNVSWTLPSLTSRTVVTVHTTTTVNLSGGAIVGEAQITSGVTCLTPCFQSATLFTSKPSAKVSLRLSPTAAHVSRQIAGCGLPACYYVAFTATYSYTSLSNDSCAFGTPVTWDGKAIFGGSIQLQAAGTSGCSGSAKETALSGLAPGAHRVCAGTTTTPGIFVDVACATFTILAAPMQSPTHAPPTTPRPTAPSPTTSGAPSPPEAPSPTAESTSVATAAASPAGADQVTAALSPSPAADIGTSDQGPPGAVWVVGAAAAVLAALGVALVAFRGRGR